MVRKTPRKEPAVIKQPEGQAHELADSVIDTVREPLLALDQDLRVIKVNRSFYETFKLKPEESIGQPIYDLGNKLLDIPQLRELLESIVPQTTTFDGYEIEYDFRDIGWRTMLLNARQIPGALGKDQVILLAIEDITERRQAEERLLRSEERYRTIFGQMLDSFYEVDLAGNFTSVNDSFCDNVGYTREELIGSNYRQITTDNYIKPVYQSFNRVFNTGEPNKGFINGVIRKDGKVGYFESSIAPLRNDKGKIIGFRCVGRDISERKRLEEALAKSEERYRTIFEQMLESYYEVDLAGTYTFVNESVGHSLGYSSEELIGQNYRLTVHEDDIKSIFAAFNEVYRTGKPNKGFPHRIRRKDGRIFFSEVSIDLIRNAQGQIKGFKCVSRDINDRKLAEEALRESEEQFRTSLENAPDGVYMNDLEGNFLYGNRRCEEIIGYKREELIGKNFTELNIFTEDSLSTAKQLLQANRKGKSTGPDEMDLIRKDGHRVPIEINSSVIQRKGQPAVLVFARDITERKKAEEKVLVANERLEYLVSASSVVIYASKTSGDYGALFISGNVVTITGYSKEEFLKDSNFWLDHIHPEDRAIISNEVQQVFEKGRHSYEYRFRCKDGKTIWVRDEMRLVRDNDGNPLEIIGVWVDVTERKQADEAILRSKLLLQSVLDSTPDWMYVKDFQHRFLLVNKSFAGAQNLTPKDMIGRADSDFFSQELCLGNPNKGIQGFHADDYQAFQGQMVHNPRNIVTWADGSIHTYDTFRIPLTDQSGKIYAALVYSRDITEQRKAENELEFSFRKVQKTLHDVINTMAKIVEMRDPYTSGHQGRVADLAGAIAREMRLDNARVEHLMMAASIHDVGKMYVPSDILSKPGKLSDIEWAMIRTHVQGSYDILKDLEFSQPIALMALQHHERLDGSGYPNQLKSENILLEAKILAVADVVEAMSSHRPYRPALGFDKAFEELSKNRGKLYDPDVVDTCLDLFNSGRFEFKPV